MQSSCYGKTYTITSALYQCSGGGGGCMGRSSRKEDRAVEDEVLESTFKAEEIEQKKEYGTEDGDKITMVAFVK